MSTPCSSLETPGHAPYQDGEGPRIGDALGPASADSSAVSSASDPLPSTWTLVLSDVSTATSRTYWPDACTGPSTGIAAR